MRTETARLSLTGYRAKSAERSANSQRVVGIAREDGDMKNSKTCPKCQSVDIIRIPGDVRAFGAENNILVGGRLLPKFVPVTRYLCSACGFSEEWIDSAEDVAKLKEVFSAERSRPVSMYLYGRNLAVWIVIVLALLALFTLLQATFR